MITILSPANLRALEIHYIGVLMLLLKKTVNIKYEQQTKPKKQYNIDLDPNYIKESFNI